MADTPKDTPRSDATRHSDEALWAAAEACVQRISDSLLANDLDAWTDGTTMPLTLHSRTGTIVIGDQETRRRNFEMFRASIQTQQVTEILRILRHLQVIDSHQMVATYDTHILRHAERVVDPYQSSANLRLGEDGIWRVSSVTNALGHVNWARMANPNSR